MLDLGIIGKGRTEDYDTKFLNEIVPGEEISGEIYIGELKRITKEKIDSFEFYVVLTDSENKIKWVVKLVTSYYPDTGNIYGERGGRVYTFIDTLNHVLNKEPVNEKANYSVNFKTFRRSVNDNISMITIKAIHPTNPNAKYVTLQVVSAQLKDEKGRRLYTSLDDLAHQNPVMRIAYTNLREEGKDITAPNLAFELKSMKDREEINENEFKSALQRLDEVGKH
ncbi:MAG: hypothetical protein LUQ24_07530 [Methanobacterium sp.]|nr:hypothetical protein [Methanobacterium sp.]